MNICTSIILLWKFPQEWNTTSKGICGSLETSKLLTQKSMWYLRIKKIWFSTKEINFPLIHKIFESLIGWPAPRQGLGSGMSKARPGPGFQGEQDRVLGRQRACLGPGGPRARGREEMEGVCSLRAPRRSRSARSTRPESCRMSKSLGTGFIFILL